jgi:hypothetical protein
VVYAGTRKVASAVEEQRRRSAERLLSDGISSAESELESARVAAAAHGRAPPRDASSAREGRKHR